MNRKKWASSLLVLSMMSVTALTGCGKTAETTSATIQPGASAAASTAATSTPAKPVKLKLAIWEAQTDIEFWTEKVKEYTKQVPNVTVEIEKVPDNNGQYLKVRLAANDLPDVFFVKPAQMQVYKQALLPLDDLDATKNNTFPAKIDGQVLGDPLVSFSEYVYYHPSIFKELSLEVPKTLPEFEALLDKIKASGKYIPLSIGLKDGWTSYPYMEYGPHMLSGDENYLANIAKKDAPFAEGTSFDQAAKFLQRISTKKWAGPDALSISFDQSTQAFEAKKAAIIALGQWYYPDYKKKVGNDDDLAAFPLPWRNSANDPLMSMTMSDMNIGISKQSKNTDAAKAFVNWMFSKDVYQTYINKVQQTSTVNGVTSELPFFVKSNQENPFKPFTYMGTDATYAKVKGFAQYDPNLVAQDIFSGKSLDSVEKELNDKWKKAIDSSK
ncbi:hypothetical protein BC351_29690 [Paenibacillus ferrarius]|uniref:Sugar ABC transporter substrate-binding protein n=1 Tax=Paenibacillus ferrarius TaxID=1469647 RepID=A0A1V4HHA8_9BACL|nr:extracellular solute-binding protein [Paenibacillus ferrarius]OPH56061.1 hypothetical protein BC351_29690 [Paenibacillus ferrarius]